MSRFIRPDAPVGKPGFNGLKPSNPNGKTDAAFEAAHRNSDVNFDKTSQHHRLGPGPLDAAPGNHTHPDPIGVKLGTAVAWVGPTLPSGYFPFNGAAISRTTYAKFFALVGTYYGVGDGSTTFNLPNMPLASTQLGYYIGKVV